MGCDVTDRYGNRTRKKERKGERVNVRVCVRIRWVGVVGWTVCGANAGTWNA